MPRCPHCAEEVILKCPVCWGVVYATTEQSVAKEPRSDTERVQIAADRWRDQQQPPRHLYE